MYGWVWRRLPFGTVGKLLTMLAFAAAVGALLWYLVFPVVDLHLPADDGQVTSGNPGPVGSPSPTRVAG